MLGRMCYRRINHERWFEEIDKFMNFVSDGTEYVLFTLCMRWCQWALQKSGFRDVQTYLLCS